MAGPTSRWAVAAMDWIYIIREIKWTGMRWTISVTSEGEKIDILSFVVEKPEEKGHLEGLDLEGKMLKSFLN